MPISNQNPYLPPEKQDPDWIDNTIGIAKFGRAAWEVPGALWGLGSTVVGTGGHGLLSSIPFVGGLFGTPDVAANVTNGLGDGVKNVFKPGFIGQAVAVGVAVGRGVQSIQEFSKGNTKSGLAKIVRGVAEGGFAALNIAGLAAIPDLLSKAFTGKFLSTHIGDLAEGAAKGTVGLVGIKDKHEVTMSTPAAVAMNPKGLNYGQNVGGQKLNFGAAPPGIQQNVAASTTQPGYWQNHVMAQRGATPQQPSVMSGNANFQQQVVNQRAAAALAAQQGQRV